MRPIGYIALFLSLTLVACAAPRPPRFHQEALLAVERVRGEGAETLLPAQYRSLREALQKGELLLQQEALEEAEGYFEMTLLKGGLLERELAEEKERRREAERLDRERHEAELKRLARLETERLAQARAAEEARALREAAEQERKRSPRPQKEYPQVTSHTVRRGETLPLIASRPEVFGDRSLWPLIYRANRDQIGDPRHIWPGQVLRIPRNAGREDVIEARRYAQEHSLR